MLNEVHLEEEEDYDQSEAIDIHQDAESQEGEDEDEEPSIEKKESLNPRRRILSPRHVGSAGKFRYLRPSEVENGGEHPYDFAVIANRSIKVPGYVNRFSFMDCFSKDRKRFKNKNGFRRLCLVSSPLLQESEDEHKRIVDNLCSEGLIVDIIDGGHSDEEMASDYFILLIRASDSVVKAYLKRFRKELWLENGNIGDFEMDISDSSPPTPAERIQIVDYIVEQRANLTTSDPWIHDMFPVHDVNFTNELVSKWISSFGRIEFKEDEFVNSLRYNFGEKVAYYFAFIHFYNRGLLPIAIIGLIYQFLHGVIPMEVYMKMLPFWGLSVCIIWSFSFLRKWDRRNACMQFEWNNRLNVKQIEYPNKYFHGTKVEDPVTGETVIVYPSWKRLPKYFCVLLFMLFQTAIMLFLVTLWVSIYEMLKVKYKDGSIFSTQWFLILSEGIVFGLFVDVIQWNIVVTKLGRLFTHWENYRTEEAFERALIRKLFVMDFLNYYTWFFSLAFVFVIPGFGDYLTNCLNRFFFGDAMNCCFGPYVDQQGECIQCPTGDKSATCIACTGWFTFDRHHVDLSAMFVTPIIVTQSLNMVLSLIMPIIAKNRREKARARADAKAREKIMKAGSMKILGSLSYENEHGSHLGNKSQSRYLEYSASEIEVLNKKAREVLFESEQDSYDPYNDYHVLTVQFGFTVMFSILWPLMPLACMLINSLKMRADGYRLCKTLKRPFPRKANGIGHWKNIFWTFAFVAVVVNIALICVSTGALEFYDDQCIKDISNKLKKDGKTLADFVLGPDFGCLHFTWRLILIMILEHFGLGVALLMAYRIPSVSSIIRKSIEYREKKFKNMLIDNADKLPLVTSPENKKSPGGAIPVGRKSHAKGKSAKPVARRDKKRPSPSRREMSFFSADKTGPPSAASAASPHDRSHLNVQEARDMEAKRQLVSKWSLDD